MLVGQRSHASQALVGEDIVGHKDVLLTVHDTLSVVRVVSIVNLDGRVIGQHKVRVSTISRASLTSSLALDAQSHVVETPAESQEAARQDNVIVVEGIQRLALPRGSIVERRNKAHLLKGEENVQQAKNQSPEKNLQMDRWCSGQWPACSGTCFQSAIE